MVVSSTFGRSSAISGSAGLRLWRPWCTQKNDIQKNEALEIQLAGLGVL